MLLFPSYFGGGSGHINRCLALAEALRSRGWQAAFVVAGPGAQAIVQAGFQVYAPRFPRRPERVARPGPAYTLIPDASFQVLRDGFTHPWRAMAAALEGLLLARRFRPDVLVGDVSLIAGLVGRRLGIPVVQIVRSAMHPAAPRLVWWREVPAGACSPDIRPVFAPLLRQWGQTPAERAEDLLRGDVYLVPSLPELEPLPPGLADTVYTGPLLHHTHAADLPAGAALENGQPLVYVTLGGGAGPVGSLAFLDAVQQAFTGQPWRGILSTGRRFRPDDLPPAPENLAVYAWLPGLQVIERSSAVVFHGGYGTMMETVGAGVPSVVLPFHTEQESNGRRLEQNAAACVLSPADDQDALRLQHGRWRYGEWALWVRKEGGITPDGLRKAIQRVLANPGYRAAAETLQAAAAHFGGFQDAIQVIESRL
jgi:UDP:flavonoid glycosyltransferase YjiC (YdhE family)